VSVQYGHQLGATYTVPALPRAPQARPSSRRGVPAPPGAAFAERQRGAYAFLRIDSGNELSGDEQLGGLAHERRVGESGAADVDKARQMIQRGVLAELGERGRLRVGRGGEECGKSVRVVGDGREERRRQRRGRRKREIVSLDPGVASTSLLLPKRKHADPTDLANRGNVAAS
jgi:hypothetical protein